MTTFAQPGKRDSESQDRLGVSHFEDGSVLCVLSDGVGSGRDPGRCAERVVKLVSDSFSARPKKWPIQKVLRQLVDQINESLYKEGAYLDGTASMQATLSIVALVENRLHGLNIGDSPVYLVHDSKMELMSELHVTKRSEGQRVLTQAVGMGPTLRPHEFERGLEAGDVILLASDGVTDLLKTDLALESILKQAGTARTVVQSALEKTKDIETDDLSAILINVQALGPAKQMRSVPSSFRTPELGEVIEGYTLVKDLSPNGRVWLAESEFIKRVVIKFIPQEAETDDSGVTAARFTREAWNASRITGPEFVPAWLPSDGSDRYFLMEYVDSPSVAKLIETRRLTLEETVSLGRFLCNAGQSLLSHEILHCDIKPENVLITQAGFDAKFKLLDLGMAHPVFTAAADSGTASYLAPERFSGAVVTERTEIYAIGVTLFQALTGKFPFGQIERFQKPEFGTVARPSKYNPNIPPWLDLVILKCLAVRPANRFQNYSELMFALENPDKAPLDLTLSGPLLETNPLLFYKAGFFLFLATTVLLLFAYILCPHH